MNYTKIQDVAVNQSIQIRDRYRVVGSGPSLVDPTQWQLRLEAASGLRTVFTAPLDHFVSVVRD